MNIKAAVTHSQGKAFKLGSVGLADPEFDKLRVRIVAAGVFDIFQGSRSSEMRPLHPLRIKATVTTLNQIDCLVLAIKPPVFETAVTVIATVTD